MASASIAVSGRLVANMLLRELLVLVRLPGLHRPDATTDSSLARLDRFRKCEYHSDILNKHLTRKKPPDLIDRAAAIIALSPPIHDYVVISHAGATPFDGARRGPRPWSWPSIKFYPNGKVRSILNHVQSQHFAAIFGDYANELLDLRRLLDIKAVVDR